MQLRRPLSLFHTISEALQTRVQESPDFPVFTFEANERPPEVLTYSHLESSARAICREISDRKLGTGPVILLYRTNSASFARVMFGCFMAGTIGVPLMLASKAVNNAHVGSIIRDSRAKAIFTLSENVHELIDLLRASNLRDVDVIATDDIVHRKDVCASSGNLHPETIAHLQYTSGSTRTPKGVAITNANILHNLHYIDEGFCHSSESISVSWVPHFHDMGLVYGFLAPALIGFRGVYLKPAHFVREPSLWLATITKYSATHSGGPNFAYDLCCNRITSQSSEQFDLKSWRVAFLGAETIRAATLDRFANAFSVCGFSRAAYYPAYGLAEATLKVTGRSTEHCGASVAFSREQLRNGIAQAPSGGDDAVDLVSTGSASSEMSVIVVDPKTLERVGPGSVGEIWVSGPSIAAGYWNNPTETSRSFQASTTKAERRYLRTGDLGFLKNDQLFVIGRLKDVIVVRGANFYPEDIEESMSASHSSVSGRIGAAFTTSVMDDERLVLVQEVDRHYLQDELHEARECIRARIASRFGLIADEILLVRRGLIPRTSSGKVQRGRCRELYEKGLIHQVNVTSNRGPDSRTIRTIPSLVQIEDSLLAAATNLQKPPKTPIDPLHPLLGRVFDSFDFARFHAAACRVFELNANLQDLMAAATIRELSVRIQQLLIDKKQDRLAVAPRSPLSEKPRSITADAEDRFLALDAIYPNCPAHRLVFGVTISSAVDADRLHQALQDLISANPTLRKAFLFSDDRIIKRITPTHSVPLEQINGEPSVESRDRESLIKQVAQHLVRTPIALAVGCPLLTALIRFSRTEHCLIVCVHHIVFDAISVSLFVDQLEKYYSTPLENVPARSDELHGFASHGSSAPAWSSKDLDFWVNYLSGAPEVVDLPGRTGLEMQIGTQASSRELSIPDDLRRTLDSANSGNATPFMILFASFWKALAEWTEKSELVVATAVTGRYSDDEWDQIGLFAQPVLLNLRAPAKRSLSEFVLATKGELTKVLAHSHVPFGAIVRALHPNNRLQRLPFLQVMFTYVPYLHRRTQDLHEVSMTLLPLDNEAIESLINVTFQQTCDGTLTARLRFPRDCFMPESITCLACLYESELSAISAAPSMSEATL